MRGGCAAAVLFFNGVKRDSPIKPIDLIGTSAPPPAVARILYREGLLRSLGAPPLTTISNSRRRCRGRSLPGGSVRAGRSEEHTSELQSLMRISYAVFCLKNKI